MKIEEQMGKGFSYTLEDDKVLAYLKLSTEDELKWLEEIIKFNNLTLRQKEKDFAEGLKR
ncbi:MAG: hypothetical protein NTU90_08585 [Proteobacteria bacterium]|nr:hypothetical protein [Pseudomonadota bacterium]